MALATFVALASTTLAEPEPERPRIYYPRHVKRQFGNSTTIVTSSESLTPETTPATTDFETTTKRDSLGDLISEILGGDETTTSKKATATKTASDSGILVGPSGIVTTSDASDAETTTTKKPGLLDPVITALLPDPETTTTTAASDDGTTTKKAAATTTKKAETTAEPETTSKPGLLDPIITAILPDPETTNTTAVESTTPTASPSGSPVTTSDGGILPTLLPPPETSTTESTPNTTLPDETTTMPTIPVPTSVPTTDLSEIPTNTTMPDEPSVTPTSILTTLPTTEPTDVPITNVTSPVEPTSAPLTELPTTTGLDEPTVNSTAVAPPTTTETEAPVPTTPTTPTAPTVPTVKPTPAETQTHEGVTSIVPTATYTNTGEWLPSTIVAEPTTNSWVAPTNEATATNTQGLPTDIPKVILPDNPDKKAPAGTVPIQLGFLYPLNYVFVAKNTVAAAQIFQFLPQGLADAGGFDVDKIQITKLVPYDTQSKWGYVTTLVKLYYPENMIDKLQTHLWAPNSALYNNDKDIISALMNNINPKIDIFGDNESGGQYGSTPDSSDSSSGGNSGNNDAFDGDSGKSSSKQMGTTAGIAVGAVSLSVMYGAAMFIVARRYKRKRQAGHARASSVGSSQASSEMQYNGTGSPALMGGALLSRDMSGYGGVAGGRESHGSGRSGASNSARTANISAPVAAENSLGWN